MLTLTLTKDEVLKLKFLLRDIQLIQKINNAFDNEAIEILSFKIVEHINIFENNKIVSSETEISDEEIEKASYNYAELYQCPTELKMCKHDVISAWNNAIKWYKEQLKQRQ